MKILVIEGTAQITETLKLIFSVGWPYAQILPNKNGDRAAELVKSESPDLVILDLKPIGMSGFGLIKAIRAFSDVLIIAIDGESRLPDGVTQNEVQSLTAGADGYFHKSLDSTIIFARIRALLRRFEETPFSNHDIIRFGTILIDPNDRRFIVKDGHKVFLTNLEWKLLLYMVRNAEKTLSKQRIAQNVWGTTDAVDVALKERIRSLRIKLGDNLRVPKLIRSHRGEGYSLHTPSQ